MWQFFHKKYGFTKSKIQRFSCKDCYKKFTLKKKNKSQKLYNSYITEKKILNTLAKENKKSLSTIYNAFKLIKIKARKYKRSYSFSGCSKLWCGGI